MISRNDEEATISYGCARRVTLKSSKGGSPVGEGTFGLQFRRSSVTDFAQVCSLLSPRFAPKSPCQNVKSLLLLVIIGAIIFLGGTLLPKKAIAEKKEEMISLDGTWKFKEDSKEVGLDESWFHAQFDDQNWSTITVPAFWEKAGFENMDGVAWYRTKVPTPIFSDREHFALSFGAVDDECAVWFNGKKLGEHKGWNEPFYFDVTSLLNKSSDNVLVVRVVDWGQDGGIWKPVRLKTFRSEEDLLKGEFYERLALKSADWVKDAVIYEVYLRSFSQDGKFQDLEARLQELKNLGVSCIWLMPIQPIGELKRKGSLGSPYSVKDYYAVNREHGTKDTFKNLVQSAHQLGMQVIIDWVANHTAWDNPMITSHPDWFQKNKEGEIASPHPHWSDVAGLNYQNAELRKYMKDVLIYWVKEFDIDGFRCDVADMLPIDFWEDARRELAKLKPNLLMLAEGDRPEDHLAAFDLTYAWNLYDALVEIVKGKADATLIERKLKVEQYKYPQGSLHLRFTENHDKPRAAEVFGPAHFAAIALIFTLDGVPLIYNGQEIGETHEPSLFEKEPIHWQEATGDERFRFGASFRKHSRPVGEERKTAASAIRKFYKKLGALRREHPALSRGQSFRVKSSDDKQLFSFARSYRDDAVLVAVNLSTKEFRGALELPEIFKSGNGKLELKAIFPGKPLQLESDASVHLTFPAWGYQIWIAK